MSNHMHWWEGFFSSLWMDIHDELKTPEETLSEVDFIESVLGLKPGDSVLDAPCGSGSHAIQLAKRGYHVTGIDLIPALVDLGRTRGEGLEIHWETGDMRYLPWGHAFDAAYCYWGSFGYFDYEGDLEFVGSIASALKPGGRFLIDTGVVETRMPRFQQRDWTRIKDGFVLEDRTWDIKGSRIVCAWTLVKGHAIETAITSIRLYTYKALVEVLRSVGFETFQAYASLDREHFGLGAHKLLLIATKGD